MPVTMHTFAAIARLSLPNLVAFVATMLIAAIDGITAARLGAPQLAAVALVLPFQMLLVQTSNGAYGAAIAGLMARARGAADTRRASAIAWHAGATAVLIGLLVGGLGLGFARALLGAAGGAGAVLDLAAAYAVPIFLGSLLAYLNGALSGIARGQGRMWLPAGALLLAAGCHALLAPPLAARLGVQGIGISWAVAFGVSLLPMGFGIRRSRVLGRFADFRWERAQVGAILRVGVPAMVTVLMSNLCVVLSVRYAAGFGQDVLIGFGIGARLEYVLVPFAFSIGISLVALAGQARGAGDHAAARRLAMAGVLASGALLGVIGTAVALFPELWLRWFAIDAAAHAVAADYLRLVGPFYLFFGFGLTAFFASQAFGRVMPAMAGAAMRVLAVLAGGTLVVRQGGEPAALFAAFAVAFALYGLANLLAIHVVSRPPRQAADADAGVAVEPRRAGV